jgi:tRNA (guanosine-2'-O-)-methyltransferase
MTRREQSRDHRGYFGIGIENAKKGVNVGTLWRSAYCLGAAFIFTVGRRCPREASDTVKAWRHIPLLEYADTEDFLAHRPYDCELIGVELCEQAKPLETFRHPERAIYLLGPEDGSLSAVAQAACQSVVQFGSRYCLNVAAAGTVVMYDRQTKRGYEHTPSVPIDAHGPDLAPVVAA